MSVARTAPSRSELATRLEDMRRSHDRLKRRTAELGRIWAETRARRSEIRTQRVKVRADLQMRRGHASTDDRRAAAAMLEAAMTVSGMSLTQLWLDYVALGGTASRSELTALLAGTSPLDRPEHDVIALALNERLRDAGYGPVVAYWNGYN